GGGVRAGGARPAKWVCKAPAPPCLGQPPKHDVSKSAGRKYSGEDDGPSIGPWRPDSSVGADAVARDAEQEVRHENDSSEAQADESHHDRWSPATQHVEGAELEEPNAREDRRWQRSCGGLADCRGLFHRSVR